MKIRLVRSVAKGRGYSVLNGSLIVLSYCVLHKMTSQQQTIPLHASEMPNCETALERCLKTATN